MHRNIFFNFDQILHQFKRFMVVMGTSCLLYYPIRDAVALNYNPLSDVTERVIDILIFYFTTCNEQ